MELEVVRIVADWLNGVTTNRYSVNALLPSTPRDAGDAQPPDVAVYDATRDEWVARKIVPNDDAVTLPALAVFLADTPQLDGEVETVIRDGKCSVGIAYFLDQSDLAESMRNALYTKRTILRSLKQLHENANATTVRLRNNVQLRLCEQLRLVPTVGHWGGGNDSGDSWLATAILADYTVRDLAP